MVTWQTYDGEVYDDDGVLIEVDGEDPSGAEQGGGD